MVCRKIYWYINVTITVGFRHRACRYTLLIFFCVRNLAKLCYVNRNPWFKKLPMIYNLVWFAYPLDFLALPRNVEQNLIAKRTYFCVKQAGQSNSDPVYLYSVPIPHLQNQQHRKSILLPKLTIYRLQLGIYTWSVYSLIREFFLPRRGVFCVPSVTHNVSYIIHLRFPSSRITYSFT